MPRDVGDLFAADVDDAAVAQAFEVLFAGFQHGDDPLGVSRSAPLGASWIDVPTGLAFLIVGIAVIGLEDRWHIAFQDLDLHGLLEQDAVALLAIPAVRVLHTVLADAFDDKPDG